MDVNGEAHLSSVVKDFSKHGLVLISGLESQPKEILRKQGLYDIIGEEHFFKHTGDALKYALSNYLK